MPNQTLVNTAITNASYAFAVRQNNDLSVINAGNLPMDTGKQQYFRLNIIATQYRANIADYTSSTLITLYNRLVYLTGFTGNIPPIDPNFVTPGVTIDVTSIIEAQGNFIRIPFAGQTTVTLANFQTTYAPTYGNDAIVTIWVTTDNYATSTQDTSTVPTITNAGGDINKPDSYTWDYGGVQVTGYVQINGFNASGGSTSAQPPITNSGTSFLSNAQLNTLYPFALWNQYVLIPAINVQYIKMDNSPTGLWSYEPYNPNT